jgi:hypothetical protein
MLSNVEPFDHLMPIHSGTHGLVQVCDRKTDCAAVLYHVSGNHQSADCIGISGNGISPARMIPTCRTQYRAHLPKTGLA